MATPSAAGPVRAREGLRTSGGTRGPAGHGDRSSEPTRDESSDPTPSSASRAFNERSYHKTLSSRVIVGRVCVEMFLLPLVGRGDETHDLRRFHLTDFWDPFEVVLRGVEDRADGSEPFEQVLRERLADAGQALDQEALALFEGQRLGLVAESVLRGASLLAFPQDAEEERGLVLVDGRQDRDTFADLDGEERAEERLRTLVRRDLREVSLEDEEGLRVRFAEAPELLEQSLPDHRVEEIGYRLSLDAHGSEDVVARRDAAHFDRDLEVAEPICDILRFIHVDDEGHMHDPPNRRSGLNVPVGWLSSALAKP